MGFTGQPGGRLREIVDVGVRVSGTRIEHAEHGHMILDHVIAVALKMVPSGA